MNEELRILHKRRLELIEYISSHNLQEQKHYMKFVELQDVNLEITKICLDNNIKYDYKNLDEDLK
jgi:hypothetical protein